MKRKLIYLAVLLCVFLVMGILRLFDRDSDA